MKKNWFSQQRRAGILLHPTSLPGPMELGDIGGSAFAFLDFMQDAGLRVWQMLPICPTLDDRSPYQGLSSYAASPLLINLQQLVEEGWLSEKQLPPIDAPNETRLYSLREAYQGFREQASDVARSQFIDFKREQVDWLDTYALFNTIRNQLDRSPWWTWPIALRDRHPQALLQLTELFKFGIDEQCFQQFVFHRQWKQLKAAAHARGIELFGDIPIFVAHDSADVWANPTLFQLNAEGIPSVVAGVPPDYFSATGQRWGNPLYRWENMQKTQFHWWRQRFEWQLSLFDMIRVDHFRGFAACWEVPAHEETAINGRWVSVPGEALFAQLNHELPDMKLIAEDLGVITDDVIALKNRFGFPGMKILQFAFGGGATNPYLPHNHHHNDVLYTGTHDNDTLMSWYGDCSEEEKEYMHRYLGYCDAAVLPTFLRTAFSSVASMVIVPMQDFLGLGKGYRMNTPGVTENNWSWRFQWDQVPQALSTSIKTLVTLYGRNL